MRSDGLTSNARRLLQVFERLRPQMLSPAMRRLSELQLSHSHMRVLHTLLSDARPLPMKELADRLGLTPPSVTALARRLVQTGLVERRPHPEDSRVALLLLTDAGRGLGHELRAEQLASMERLLEGLSPPEQEQLLDLLERAVRRPAGDEGQPCPGPIDQPDDGAPGS